MEMIMFSPYWTFCSGNPPLDFRCVFLFCCFYIQSVKSPQILGGDSWSHVHHIHPVWGLFFLTFLNFNQVINLKLSSHNLTNSCVWGAVLGAHLHPSNGVRFCCVKGQVTLGNLRKSYLQLLRLVECLRVRKPCPFCLSLVYVSHQ